MFLTILGPDMGHLVRFAVVQRAVMETVGAPMQANAKDLREP